MSAADDALLDALELGSLMLGEVPGRARFLAVPGVRVRESSIDSPFVNLVGLARLRAEDADAAIARIREHFASRGQQFGWMVGPRSTPADLIERLERHGVRKTQECLGLVLRDLDAPIPSAPDVDVREVGPGERDAFDDVKARSFGMPLGVAAAIDELICSGIGGVGRLHIAYLDGAPVAFGQTFYEPRTGVVVLGGSGTVPEARGRGVFRALLARRLADAKADGMRAAAIQAYADTSAPILLRVGFAEIARLWFCAWRPPAA